MTDNAVAIVGIIAIVGIVAIVFGKDVVILVKDGLIRIATRQKPTDREG